MLRRAARQPQIPGLCGGVRTLDYLEILALHVLPLLDEVLEPRRFVVLIVTRAQLYFFRLELRIVLPRVIFRLRRQVRRRP